MRACGFETIPMFAVHVREIAPPNGVEPLDWILLTSEPVECFEDAWTVIGYYEERWRVEDYHKCLKTGCQVESRQYKTSDRLERVTFGPLKLGRLSLGKYRQLRDNELTELRELDQKSAPGKNPPGRQAPKGKPRSNKKPASRPGKPKKPASR